MPDRSDSAACADSTVKFRRLQSDRTIQFSPRAITKKSPPKGGPTGKNGKNAFRKGRFLTCRRRFCDLSITQEQPTYRLQSDISDDNRQFDIAIAHWGWLSTLFRRFADRRSQPVFFNPRLDDFLRVTIKLFKLLVESWRRFYAITHKSHSFQSSSIERLLLPSATYSS